MKVTEYLSKQPRSVLVALGLLFVVLVGIIDHLTGPELFLSIFYLIPIFLVTWFTARWIGIMMSVASALSWLIADFTAGHTYSHPAVPYWNVAVRFGSFLIATLILSALKTTLEHEKELARTDSLTGISNGRSFVELAHMEINRARRYKHPFTVVNIDLDNFKEVNDQYGHSTGDTLLCSVADTIRTPFG